MILSWLNNLLVGDLLVFNRLQDSCNFDFKILID